MNAVMPFADRRLWPYCEHALISDQEHEAWDVLLVCQGQLRLAPSGQVIGIDMHAALKIGAARDYNLAVLSELLPAAEAGVVEVVWSDEFEVKGLDQAPAIRADYGIVMWVAQPSPASSVLSARI